MADEAFSTIAKHKGETVALIGLLILSFLLLSVWAFAVPVYEAPDEPHHWNYARYLHDNWKLPLYSDAMAEGNSPPLYYLLVAPAAADTPVPKPIVDSSFQSLHPPRFFDDTARDLSLYWPIRAARLITLALSTCTVLFCYLAGREATGRATTGLLAGGLAAFLPQFTFRGMNVSNDALVALTCAAATYLTIRLIRKGFAWRLGLAAAIVVALAFLSKTNAIFLPAPVGLAIFTAPGTWKQRFARLSVLGVSLLIAAPWLIRNQLLYGDPLASRIMLTVVHNILDVKPITSPYFLSTFPSILSISFVGVFGWMNLGLPEWIYAAFSILGIAAVAGYLWQGLHRQFDARLTLILLTFPLLSLAITVYINLSFSQPQGRYLFPSLAAIAVLVSLGLEKLPGWSKPLAYGLLAFFLLINVYVVAFVIVPAYWN